MKKKKILTQDDFKMTYKEGEGITFNVNFPSISSPRDEREVILKGALYNPLSLAAEATGTAYGFFVGDLSNPVKLYLHCLKYQNDNGGWIVEISKDEYEEYHHIRKIEDIKKIPSYIIIPDEAMNKIHDTIISFAKKNN